MGSGFQCASCGEWHAELPLNLGFAEPLQVAELDEAEGERCVTKLGDFRLLERDGQVDRFVRGVVEIPIIGTTDNFCYGVWASLSEKSYAAASAAYAEDAPAGPFFGWFSNRLAGYPETLNLKTDVRVRTKVRPTIALEPTDHPLSIEQRQGITLDRVKEIIQRALHPSQPKPGS
jgi:hypothetical protein